MTNGNVVTFNPLDKRHLGESVGQAMLRRPVFPLEELSRFDGAGVYAIYYTGDFPAYEVVSAHNRDEQFRAPIYVGKAVPKGTRTGSNPDAPPGTVLFSRLRQHLKTLEEASNLRIEDFHLRHLIVDDIWIPLAESLLIAKFSPVWNTLIDGFGNHDPGGRRYGGLRPRWDVLHPGRPWADRCQPRAETAEEIICEVGDYLRNNPPPRDATMITAETSPS